MFHHPINNNHLQLLVCWWWRWWKPHTKYKLRGAPDGHNGASGSPNTSPGFGPNPVMLTPEVVEVEVEEPLTHGNEIPTGNRAGQNFHFQWWCWYLKSHKMLVVLLQTLSLTIFSGQLMRSMQEATPAEGSTS